MKTVTKPEIDLWFDPPEMDEDEKAEVLRAALDEAWESDARGESITFTSLEESREFIREIGRQAQRRVDAKREAEMLIA